MIAFVQLAVGGDWVVHASYEAMLLITSISRTAAHAHVKLPLLFCTFVPNAIIDEVATHLASKGITPHLIYFGELEE